MLKKVRIKIETDRLQTSASLFQPQGKQTEQKECECAEPDHLEMIVEGRYHDDGTRVSIAYEEGELSGMEGSSATVSFSKSEPALVSMTRTGSVKTALIFERGKRHFCYYQTPIMPFEVCVHTKRVQNDIETSGTLVLDYTVELRGAMSEATHLKLQILPHFEKPLATE